VRWRGFFHNGFATTSRALCRWLFGYSRRDCKTLAIETGMQNSGLAAARALKYFAPSAARCAVQHLAQSQRLVTRQLLASPLAVVAGDC